MTEKEKENRISAIMTGLKCDRTEAEDIFNADCDIDRGKSVPFGLTPEREKEVLKEAHKGKKKKTPPAYKWNKREKKVNGTKKGIIEYLTECFKDYENFAVINPEKLIKFSADGNDYELSLIQKRKPKS